MANDVQLQIQAEQEAQATVISYADWLVTTMNDALPEQLDRSITTSIGNIN